MRALLIGTVLLLALGLIAQAKEPERPRCDNCGMFTDASSTNVKVVLKVNGKQEDHNFVCLDCVFEYMTDKVEGKAELVSLKVLDYDTAGSKTPKFIDGKTAYYLVGTKPLKGSMEPWIAAFVSKAAATTAKKTLGGAVKNWSDTWAGITSADESEGSQGSAGEDEYVCSCAGGCCDDVHSDKPGTCPNCGMKMVKKSEK